MKCFSAISIRGGGQGEEGSWANQKRKLSKQMGGNSSILKHEICWKKVENIKKLDYSEKWRNL
jgi:hypothetical protein